MEEARAELRRALKAGNPVSREIVDRLIFPLMEKAVPEWQAILDALLSLLEIRGPVEFAGSFVPRTILEEARHVTIPVLVLLQWDDDGNDRQMALDLFDAFGSKEKTLHANMGGHTGVPPYEQDAGIQFFTRHLA